MAQYAMYITVEGNGTAYASPNPQEEGQTVTLYCTPDTGETLDDIDARTPQGYSFALALAQVQTFTMPSYDLTIKVKFSGTTPPTPPSTRKKKGMPLWMMLRRRYIEIQ